MLAWPDPDDFRVRCECGDAQSLGERHWLESHRVAARRAIARGPQRAEVSDWRTAGVVVSVPSLDQPETHVWGHAEVADSGQVLDMVGSLGPACLKAARRFLRERNRLIRSRAFADRCIAEEAATFDCGRPDCGHRVEIVRGP